MSGNKPTIQNKISPIIHGQLPQFVQSEHQLFSTFLKHYYEFMEAAEVVLGGSNDYVIQETNSVNYIVDQDGDNVVLESSTGKFITGETLVGSISNYSAKLLVDDYDDNKKLFISSQQRFEVGEKIVGQTSGASAEITQYRANPVQNIQQLLAYADVDNTVWAFLDKFKNSLLESIPQSIANDLDQRNLIKNIKDLYEAKGTEDGHRLFFRILFDEGSEFLYPRENMIKTSDGQWSDDFVMRVVEIGTSNFQELIGETITGKDSGATAIISSLVKFKSGADTVTELNLDKTTLEGDFTIGEVVAGISSVIDLEITATLSAIVGNVTINNGMSGMMNHYDEDYKLGGQYYTVGDNVRFEKLGTIGVRGQVSRVGAGSIDVIDLANSGTGYAAGDTITFNNLNTNGQSAAAKLAVIGGSFILEDFTSPDSIVQNCSNVHDLIIEHTDQLDLEESTLTNINFELETATGAGFLRPEDGTTSLTSHSPDYFIAEKQTEYHYGTVYQNEGLLLEDGNKIVREEATPFNIGMEQDLDSDSKLLLESGDDIIVEQQTFTDLGVASEAGQITKVTVTNKGNGYTSLPSITINTTTGSGAKLIALSESGVGRVLDVKITNYGLNYTGVPKITFNKKIIVKNSTGNFTIGDTLTSFSGSIVNWNTNTGILELETDVEDFSAGDILTSSGGITATVVQEDSAEATTSLEAVVRSDGTYITDKGKLSEDTQRVQDSFYYQDYSYVVRIGESINQWRESIRRSVHPAGWNVFGEVSFATSLAEAQLNSLRIQNPAAGSVGDYDGDETFTPELASVLTTLFQNIFGRRLGTKTDGTSVVSTPMTAYNEIGDVPSGRDVTLTSVVSLTIGTGNNIGKMESQLGPTLDLLPKYAFAVPPLNSSSITAHYPGISRIIRSDDNDGAYYTIDEFKTFRINEVSDGSGNIPAKAFNTRINIPPPGEIIISSTGSISNFSNSFITFDDARNEFSESGTASATPTVTDFSETAITFDTNAEKFDEEIANLPVEFSTIANTFDETTITLDSA